MHYLSYLLSVYICLYDLISIIYTDLINLIYFISFI